MITALCMCQYCEPPRMRAVLTAKNMRELTLFKWRYGLETSGFTTHEAQRLVFLKWQMTHGRRNAYQDRSI